MSDDIDTLERIQERILWLAGRMVDHANRERPPGEIKVGGHQSSSASMVGIMTALWFGHLRSQDKVAVKPHASPVYHSIKYLTGELDRSYLTRLRALGGRASACVAVLAVSGDASERAPASERPATACVAGERGKWASR